MFFSLTMALLLTKTCSLNYIVLNQYIRGFAKNIDIPLSQLSFNCSRSSGPGGQNVNKVNTKVELRIKIDDCEWIPQYSFFSNIIIFIEMQRIDYIQNIRIKSIQKMN